MIYRIEDRNRKGPFSYWITHAITEAARARGHLVDQFYHEGPMFPCNGDDHPNLWMPCNTWRCACDNQKLLFEWFPSWSWPILIEMSKQELGYAEYSAVNVRYAARQCIFDLTTAERTKFVPLHLLSERELNV